MLNGLDLFSGYGGITVGLRDWVRPVAYCEIEKYAQSILLSRMAEGEITRAPIWDDIRTFNGTALRGSVDIIYGGFPCQDISIAGAGRGLGGERSSLFFEVCRLVKEIKPSFIFLENVPAIRTRGLLEVAQSLTDLRYDCRWTRVSAREVGAPHLRQRWFLLAHANSKRLEGRDSKVLSECSGEWASGKSGTQAAHNGDNADGQRFQAKKQSLQKRTDAEPIRASWWGVEPDVGRVAYGIAHRVDRIKALGNGVVPQQVKEAFIKLIG